jgi:hypothetical protein
MGSPRGVAGVVDATATLLSADSALLRGAPGPGRAGPRAAGVGSPVPGDDSSPDCARRYAHRLRRNTRGRRASPAAPKPAGSRGGAKPPPAPLMDAGRPSPCGGSTGRLPRSRLGIDVMATGVTKSAGLGSVVLPRPALVATLERATQRKVTVISAPPGSGKSYLLRRWAETVAPPRRAVIMQLRRSERDAQRLPSSAARCWTSCSTLSTTGRRPI